MKNLLAMSFLLFPLIGFKANAACIPHSVAEEYVIGKTYKLSSSNKGLPIYLTFNSDRSASYGSMFDGNPGGIFSFKGNCHGQVEVFFRKTLGNPNGVTQLMMTLKPRDLTYGILENTQDPSQIFIIDISSSIPNSDEVCEGVRYRTSAGFLCLSHLPRYIFDSVTVTISGKSFTAYLYSWGESLWMGEGGGHTCNLPSYLKKTYVFRSTEIEESFEAHAKYLCSDYHIFQFKKW